MICVIRALRLPLVGTYAVSCALGASLLRLNQPFVANILSSPVIFKVHM